MYNDYIPRRIQPGTSRLLSDGTLSHAPRLGWIRLIDDNGNVFDSRSYGVLEITPRARYSPLTGSTVQIPGRSEPVVITDVMRQPKVIDITIGVTDERIAGEVLNAFCRRGKLIVSTHPNLYYNVEVLAEALSEKLSRRFSRITIPYTASAYRYLLDEPVMRSGALTETDGVIVSGEYVFTPGFPESSEDSEPEIYIVTQAGETAALVAEVSADGGDSFRAENLSPSAVYCIDSRRKVFYKYATIEDGEEVQCDPTDETAKTSGDFPVLTSAQAHTITYSGYVKEIRVKPNARWNI